MKFRFDDGGYLEFQRSSKPYHVHVIVAVRKSDSALELLVNSAEIHVSKLLEGVKSVSGPLILEEKGKNEQENSVSNSEDSKKEQESDQ